MYQVNLIQASKFTKVQQIISAIVSDIEVGKLKQGHKLPSINQFSRHNSVSRDTIEKAYKQLIKQGYLTSVAGRGYYVSCLKNIGLKILLIFNRCDSLKQIIYDEIIEGLKTRAKAKMDLQAFHYDQQIFKTVIEESLGKYDYYIVMPPFLPTTEFKEYLQVIEMIPLDQLILIN